MFKNKYHINLISVLAVIIMMSAILTSCASKDKDETPPTAPLLTVSSQSTDSVFLAWSESYDNVGVDEYRVFKNDTILVNTESTQYTDKDVSAGEEYEYYVVAYDRAGNRSSKSVKQNVRIADGEDITTISPSSPALTGTPEDPVTELSIQKLARSTVKLYTLDNNFNVIAMGSGTIVSKAGYILTNFHCVGESGRLYNSEGYVAIAITDDIKKNIQPQYIAQYRSGAEELDLAVVKIVSDLNWNSVSPDDLKLVPATLSDSDNVMLGDNINILGYPGVGGETITYTAGHVSGFIDEDGDLEIDWIKTDAVVNHGNSGGTAINQKGEMIGVPTSKIIGQDNDIMFYLKPINQAIAIIENAYEQGASPNLPVPEDPIIDVDPYEGRDSISIYGRIVDSYTLEPIYGAMFVVLHEGITIEAFVDNPQDSMLLSYAETGSDGLFACHYIPNDATYAVVIAADGYWSIAEDDGITIPTGWTDDVDIGDIYLEPDYY
ncbi:MAG: trypsin-like peptidase domain-containing protein [Acetivibrionales bacterium]|nr:trypsin-like serine protease [Clostridiaceae bacterium]